MQSEKQMECINSKNNKSVITIFNMSASKLCPPPNHPAHRWLFKIGFNQEVHGKREWKDCARKEMEVLYFANELNKPVKYVY